MKMTKAIFIPGLVLLSQPAWSVQVRRVAVPQLSLTRGAIVSAPRLNIGPGAVILTPWLNITPSVLGGPLQFVTPAPVPVPVAAPVAAPAAAPIAAAMTAMTGLQSGADQFERVNHDGANASAGKGISDAMFDAASSRSAQRGGLLGDSGASQAPSIPEAVFDAVYSHERIRGGGAHEGKPRWVRTTAAGLFFAADSDRHVVHLIRPDGSVQELEGDISGAYESNGRVFIEFMDNNGAYLHEYRYGSLYKITGLNGEKTYGIRHTDGKVLIQTRNKERYRLYELRDGRVVRASSSRGRSSPY